MRFAHCTLLPAASVCARAVHGIEIRTLRKFCADRIVKRQLRLPVRHAVKLKRMHRRVRLVKKADRQTVGRADGDRLAVLVAQLQRQRHGERIPRVPAQHAARDARTRLCSRKLCHRSSSFRPLQLIRSRPVARDVVLRRVSPRPLAREDARCACFSCVFAACAAAFCRACAAFSASAACLSA